MNNEANTNPTIATTILSQINSADSWARARWGVRLILTAERSLHLVCGRGVKVIVELAADDTYTITVGRSGKTRDYTPTWKVKGAPVAGAYAEDLVRVIDSIMDGDAKWKLAA